MSITSIGTKNGVEWLDATVPEDPNTRDPKAVAKAKAASLGIDMRTWGKAQWADGTTYWWVQGPRLQPPRP